MKTKTIFQVITFAVLILFSLNLSSATYDSLTSTLPTDGGTVTYSAGFGMTVKFNTVLISATKGEGVTATQAHLMNVGGTIIATALFVGNNATFNYPLTAGNVYWISADSGGLAYNRYVNNAMYGLWPVNGVHVVFNYSTENSSGSWSTGAGITAYNLLGVTTSNLVGAINLIYPTNSSSLPAGVVSFNASMTPITLNNTNATLYIWNSSGDIRFNQTNSVTGNVINYTNWSVLNLSSGDYQWNVLGCFKNSTNYSCMFSESNYSLTLESANIIEEIYSETVFETASENFYLDINLTEGNELSLVQLVYNGTNYTVSNITISGTHRIINKRIDIPINQNPLANTTNNFFWRFLFSGGSQFIQETSVRQQNVTYINLQICSATYTTTTLNFTFYDETNQTNLILGANSTTNFESNWYYWIGSGNIKKNYSFQNLSSKSINYKFCIFPTLDNNLTIKTNSDIKYSSTDYRENEYHLRNATLTNVQSNIYLYLIHADLATKFFLTFKQGNNLISDATVTVQKFFTGLGLYQTVAILLTDDNGETTMWQEVDGDYRYSIVQDGVLIGVVDRKSICSVSPCALTISIDLASSTALESYYERYAQGILSTITYNSTTKIVTYDFIDLTGLANYFRLEVKKSYLNQTGVSVCDSILYSPAGIITCNLTGQTGEFIATGYISRSPELIDKIINILVDRGLADSLGLEGLFLIIILLLVIIFAGAVVGKGSPSVVLWFLAIGLLGLKLATLLPYSWPVVITLEVIILFIANKVKV